MKSTVEAPHFGVLSNFTTCHACQQQTPVKALLVQGGRYRVEPDDEDEDWIPIQDVALLTYVRQLDAAALEVWRTKAPWVQFLSSSTAGSSYWANACRHCGALQGDWFLTEADGPFFPSDPSHEGRISLEWSEGALSAVASLCESSWLDQLAARAPREVKRASESRQSF